MQYIGAPDARGRSGADPRRLAELEGSSAQATARHRRLETWRERLLGDDEALTAFAAEHPGADLQALRTLIRNAQERAKGRQAAARLPRALQGPERD